MLKTRHLAALAGAAASFGAPALASEPVDRDEIRAIVAEMLADAETRSSLLDGGGNAGYDKGFYMASADGNYKLVISGFTQVRYTAHFRDRDGIVGPGDDFNPGFGIRQAKIRFSGNVVNPDLTFAVQGAFERGDGLNFAGTTLSGGGSFVLDDCFFNYNVGNGWSVRGGQYKPYFLKEELNSDAYTMAAERGVMNSVWSQGRSQGFGARYKGDSWWIGADITDGLKALNTDFTSSREADFAITGRFEYRFSGTDDQLKDYTSMPGDPWGANIGVAGHYQLANNDPFFAVDQNFLAYTIDGQIEGGGWSLFAAFVGSHTEFNSGSALSSLDDFGLTVQGAWRFMERDEIFLKYDGVYLDDSRGLSPDAYNFITFGYNHYFAGHAAKLTVDCLLALNHTAGLTSTSSGVVPTGATAPPNSRILPNTALGLLGVSTGFEASVRVQFQLMF